MQFYFMERQRVNPITGQTKLQCIMQNQRKLRNRKYSLLTLKCF